MTSLYLKDNPEALDTPCRCDNCDWRGPAADLDVIEDAQERLDPGAEVPAGECPDCGCLAYLLRPISRPISALRAALRACQTMDGAPALAHPDIAFARRRLRAINATVAEALADDPGSISDRPPLAAISALKAARSFIAGFEGDELQEGISELLARIDRAISAAPVYLAVHVEGGCVQGVSSNDPDALAGVCVILLDFDNEGEAVEGSFALQYQDGDAVTVCGGPLSVELSAVDMAATWANAEKAS